MALNVKKGSFTTNTDTNNQSVTGVGLGVAGEAIIFFGTWNQSAAGTVANTWSWYGFATSSTNRGARWYSNSDGVITTATGRGGSNTRCIFQQDQVPNTRLEADFVSFDGSDGNFTIDWITAPAAAYLVHYIVIGGTDLTAANVQAISLNATAGDQSYAHGLGTTPSFGMFVCINNTSLTSTTHGTLAVGWAVQGTASTRKCGSVSINASHGETMEASQDQMRVLASDRPLICMGNSVATVDIELDYPAAGGGTTNIFDGTNVTFNQVNAATLNTDLLCLFLAGGQYDAGSFAARTTTGDDSFTVSFVPKVVGFAKAQAITDGTAHTATADANMAFGAGTSTDGTAEGSVSFASTDAIEPTQVDQHTSTTKVIAELADGNPGVITAEADLTALGTTSTINWTDPPSTADIILWWAAGDNAAAGPALPIGWLPMLGVGR